MLFLLQATLHFNAYQNSLFIRQRCLQIYLILLEITLADYLVKLFIMSFS